MPVPQWGRAGTCSCAFSVQGSRGDSSAEKAVAEVERGGWDLAPFSQGTCERLMDGAVGCPREAVSSERCPCLPHYGDSAGCSVGNGLGLWSQQGKGRERGYRVIAAGQTRGGSLDRGEKGKGRRMDRGETGRRQNQQQSLLARTGARRKKKTGESRTTCRGRLKRKHSEPGQWPEPSRGPGSGVQTHQGRGQRTPVASKEQGGRIRNFPNGKSAKETCRLQNGKRERPATDVRETVC